MNPNLVFWLSILGIAIGGADGYWQIHSGTSVIDAKFYVGLAFASLAPVGTYFVGLTQKAPWTSKATEVAAAAALPPDKPTGNTPDAGGLHR